MFKNYIKIGVLSLSLAFLFFSNTSPLLADDTSNYGLDATVAGTPAKALLDPKDNTPSVLAGRLIAPILSFIGVIYFILIFYSGLKWMLAQGNDSEIEAAKKIIFSATIGLILVLSAYAITSFVGQWLTKTT